MHLLSALCSQALAHPDVGNFDPGVYAYPATTLAVSLSLCLFSLPLSPSPSLSCWYARSAPSLFYFSHACIYVHRRACAHAVEAVSFKLLVVWLEDAKIRHWKIEDREGLRNVESGWWQTEFEKVRAGSGGHARGVSMRA